MTPGRYVHLTVTDTGQGMFFQAEEEEGAVTDSGPEAATPSSPDSEKKKPTAGKKPSLKLVK